MATPGSGDSSSNSRPVTGGLGAMLNPRTPGRLPAMRSRDLTLGGVKKVRPRSSHYTSYFIQSHNSKTVKWIHRGWFVLDRMYSICRVCLSTTYQLLTPKITYDGNQGKRSDCQYPSKIRLKLLHFYDVKMGLTGEKLLPKLPLRSIID